MVKSILFAFLTIAIIIPVFNGCKKGEGDTLISLRSRKSRVAGEWKVTRYSDTWYNSSGSPPVTISNTISYDGVNWSGASAIGSFGSTWPTEPTTITKIWAITFEKDGIWKSNEVKTTTATGFVEVETIDETGLWNFETGVGEAKKKEYLTKTTSSSTTTTVSNIGNTTNTKTNSGKGGMKEVFQITTLKNKEMILHSDYTSADSNTSSGTTSSSSGSGSTDMTLTAQ